MASIRGENLKKVMEIKGWKQIHLARLTGYSRSYVSRVLSGKANPSAEFILRVGELFPGFEHNHFFIPEVFPGEKTSSGSIPMGHTQEAANT